MFIATAFIIGILVAINPCQLAINISALTYLNGKQQNGLWYVFGRIVSHTILGILVGWLVSCGINISQEAEKGSGWFELVEQIVPYILIAIAIYLVYRAFHHHEHHGDSCHNSGRIIHHPRHFSAFFMGILLAFAFCPETLIMFLSVFVSEGNASNFALSAIGFSVGAALPIFAIAYLLKKGSKMLEAIQERMQGIQKAINIAFACMLLVLAIYIMIGD